MYIGSILGGGSVIGDFPLIYLYIYIYIYIYIYMYTYLFNTYTITRKHKLISSDINIYVMLCFNGDAIPSFGLHVKYTKKRYF